MSKNHHGGMLFFALTQAQKLQFLWSIRPHGYWGCNVEVPARLLIGRMGLNKALRISSRGTPKVCMPAHLQGTWE
jgi:hypothetical protein